MSLYPPADGFPFPATSVSIALGAGVQRVGNTDYPLFEGGDDEAGGGAFVDAGVIKAQISTGAKLSGNNVVYAPNATYAAVLSINGSNEITVDFANGVQVGASEMEPRYHTSWSSVLSAPTADGIVVSIGAECEVAGGAVRANLGAAAVVSGTEVIAALDADGAVEVVGGEVTARLGTGVEIDVSNNVVPIPIAFHKVDLLNPLSVSDPNSLAPTIDPLGDGFRVTLTPQAGGQRDGADEFYRQRHAIKDVAGNTVDLTTGAWVVIVEVRHVASTPGQQIVVVAGLSTRANTTGGQHALGGFQTGTVSLSRCFVTGASDSPTVDTTLSIVRMTFCSVGNTSGSYRLPGGMVEVLTSAGAFSTENNFTQSVDASPGIVGLSVGLGTSSIVAVADVVDFEIWAVAAPIPTLNS